jgi:hypothetical protein
VLSKIKEGGVVKEYEIALSFSLLQYSTIERTIPAMAINELNAL